MASTFGQGSLTLPCLAQDLWDDIVDQAGQLEDGVFGEVRLAKLQLDSETRVGLAQDGVPITGDDLPGFQRFSANWRSSFGRDMADIS